MNVRLAFVISGGIHSLAALHSSHFESPAMEILERHHEFPEPSNHNYVKVSLLPSGKYGWSGAIQPPREEGAIFSGAQDYTLASRAKEDALDWARARGAAAVFLILPADNVS